MTTYTKKSNETLDSRDRRLTSGYACNSDKITLVGLFQNVLATESGNRLSGEAKAAALSQSDFTRIVGTLLCDDCGGDLPQRLDSYLQPDGQEGDKDKKNTQ
jgi:hypothetical protein